ncbi:hypothetical protein CFP56_030153 [Quercus suber]|uniref:CCHC-type domain-containing protein n=1 Tax=Quercus suber TaxID=58331 RepID=A0AAW0LW75_QUESU
MSTNNKEPETISLCDVVDDLVHDESEINEDQNNVGLSLDDSNQPFACNRHSEPHLNMGHKGHNQRSNTSISDKLYEKDNITLNNQVLSNLPIILQNPPHVPSKGRSKALRQKHPKEKQLMKKRKCSICKEMGHVRTNCPTHKHSEDVANTSLTPHWESVHQQQSQTKDSLLTVTYPSTSSSAMHIHPNQSSFTQ